MKQKKELEKDLSYLILFTENIKDIENRVKSKFPQYEINSEEYELALFEELMMIHYERKNHGKI